GLLKGQTNSAGTNSTAACTFAPGSTLAVLRLNLNTPPETLVSEVRNKRAVGCCSGEDSMLIRKGAMGAPARRSYFKTLPGSPVSQLPTYKLPSGPNARPPATRSPS